MFKSILIPTDGSPLATKAAKAGIALASALGAKVTCCYVVEDLRPAFGPRHGVDRQMVTEYNERARDVARKHIESIGKFAARRGVPFTSVVATGHPPHAVIAAVAKKHRCDVVFMSTHGRSGLSRLMMGSVTQKVLLDSALPVVVYR